MVAIPLTDLTKSGAKNIIPWGKAQEGAYQRLKSLLAKRPILKIADFNKTFILKTDASEINLGGCLLQEHDGTYFSVTYINFCPATALQTFRWLD